MNPDERFTLSEYEQDFIEKVSNFDELLSLLVKYNVFNESLKNRIVQTNDLILQKKELISSISKRGPLAFRKLLTCLRETNNELIAVDLEKRVAKHGLSVRKSTYRMDLNSERCYRMRSQPKGLALIINMYNYKNCVEETRLGSDADVLNLKKLWTDLGFQVQCETNLTAIELQNCVREFSQKKEHENVDCCVVFIMGHGESNWDKQGVHIKCHDNFSVYSLDIIKNFVPANCEALAGKPKLFFFQACRGRGKDYGVRISKSVVELRNKLSVQDDSDFQRSNSAPSYTDDVMDNSECAIISNLNLNDEKSNVNDNSFGIPEVIVESTLPEESVVENGGDNHNSDLENGFNEDLINGNSGIGSTDSRENTVFDSSVLRNMDESHEEENWTRPPNTYGATSDILIVYSTHPGYKSLRDEKNGSWMVQDVCEIFSKYAYNQELIEMLKMVMRSGDNRYSDKGTQYIHYENFHFSKHLFFNPGLYN